MRYLASTYVIVTTCAGYDTMSVTMQGPCSTCSFLMLVSVAVRVLLFIPYEPVASGEQRSMTACILRFQGTTKDIIEMAQTV